MSSATPWSGGGGGPSSVRSSSFRPPPTPPTPTPQSDPFDFILEEYGHLSPSREERLRNAPFLRQEKLNPANLSGDEEALNNYILHCIFGFQNPHHPGRRTPYTDAEAAELALTNYFMRLGPGRLHLLRPRKRRRRAAPTQFPLGTRDEPTGPMQNPSGTRDKHAGPPQNPSENRDKQALPKQYPSGTRDAAQKLPEGMPPPAQAHPSWSLGPAAAASVSSGEAGKAKEKEKEKATGFKRGRGDPCHPSGALSPIEDTRCSLGKKSRVNPDPVKPFDETIPQRACMTSTIDIPTMGGKAVKQQSARPSDRGFRNLPPSIVCPGSWEKGHAESERGTRLRPGLPPLQVDQDKLAKSKAPATTEAVLHSATGASFLSAGKHSSTVAIGMKEQGLDKKGGAGDRCSRGETTSLSAAGSDAVSPSTFVKALLTFSNRSNQTPGEVDIFETLAKESLKLPIPGWWRPGGYDRRSTPPEK